MTNSPKSCRSGQTCEPETLREALHCQVHHSHELGCKQIAERLGMGAGTLSDFVNPDEAGSWLNTRHLPGLLQSTPSNYAVNRYLASLQNLVLMPLPAVTQLAETGRMVSEFGELLSTLAIAQEDQRITPQEATRIAEEGQQAIAAIAAVMDDARRRSISISVPIAERRR